MATWRSGYAAVCKTVYPGSIPGVASRKIKHLTTAATDQKFTSAIRQRISGRKMMAEPETRFEELRFAKQPQWSVATATMTLLGAIFGVAHTMSPLGIWEKHAITLLAILVAVAGSLFLHFLQNHLARTRRAMDQNDESAWRRGTSILYALVVTVLIGALVVVYSLWR
jgi:hypothetical protein